MGTALYIRVSTDRQHKEGVSLETQKEGLYAYCKLKGFKDVKLYPDVGSARTTNRDNYKNMMRDVKLGNIKNIVIYKLDRLTRSLVDLNNTVNYLNEKDCGLHSCMENIDTNSAMGRMVMNLIGTFAQWESENTSEKVTLNMDYLWEQGVWMSSIPYGFYHGKDKRLKIKDDETNILREAFDMIVGGHSCTSAEKIIRNKYDLDWAQNYLRRKIRMESTIGNTERNGEVKYDTHKGVITKVEQIKLLQILEVNGNGRRFIEHDDIFRRRIVCFQCGNILNANARSSNDYKTVNYSYTCGNCYDNGQKAVSVSESILFKSLTKYMQSLALGDFHTTGKVESNKDVKPIKNRLKAIHEERDNIQRAWIKKMMTDSDLMKYRNELDAEQQLLEKELSDMGVVKPVVSASELSGIVSSFNDLFIKLPKEKQREFVQRHIMKIHFSRELIKGYRQKYDVKVKLVEFF